MRSIKHSLLLLFSLLSTPAFAVNGPDFAPPFDIQQSQRVDGELQVESFLDTENGNAPRESVSLVFGNKRLAVREGEYKKMNTGSENMLTVFVNNERVLRFRFVANYRLKGGGRVDALTKRSDKHASLYADTEQDTLQVACPYLLPDGRETEFSYTVKALGASRVELSWDMGFDKEEAERYRLDGHDFGSYLLFIDVYGDYQNKGLSVNGDSVQPRALEELQAEANQWDILWEGTMHRFSYASDRPLDGMTIESAEGLHGKLRDIFRWGRVDMNFLFNCDRPQDSIVIDFGEVGGASQVEPTPIEGHDLWSQDALHVFHPPTRNLMPNPSFEQGMRYWRWWDGGAQYERSEISRYGIDTQDALFGGQSLVVNPVQEKSLDLRSFSLPFKKGKDYTVSFYAKAEVKGASIKMAPYSSKSGGKFTRRTVQKKEASSLGHDWQRFHYTFESDGTPTAFILDVINRGGKVWMDGLQIEAGDEPTEFVSPFIEGELLTSHPENNVEYGGPVGANFRVCGDIGKEVRITLTLRDFYQQAIWSETILAHAGESIPLPLDTLGLGTGMYLLQAHYAVPGQQDYDDYYRFTIVDSLSGTHATKDLYGTIFSARTDRSEERLDMLQRFGYGGSTSYGDGKLSAPMIYELREKYHITGFGHKLFQNSPQLTAQEKADKHPDHYLAMSMNERIWRNPEEKKTIRMLDSYSPEVLAQVEEISERAARECTYVRAWSIGTEEEITFPSLSEKQDFNEFAKLQEAFYRGIKRGNPDAIVLPAGGTSGYGAVRGKEDIEGYLSATQGKIQWDAIAVHPYGSIDGTLGDEDLDEAIQMLSDSMSKYGYGPETPIWLNEGGGRSPAIWGAAPVWSYDGGQASYDQGLTEFLHASKMARQYIIALKYWPRIPHFNTWQHSANTVVDYNLTPSSFLLGINTLGHLLGNPRFVADIRPAPGVRGYLFDDAKNNAVAAIWCTIDDVERGFVRGPVMRVHFEEPLPKMVDLMGRETALVSFDDDWVDIQLTPAPIFLKGDNVEALLSALENAEVHGSGANVNLSFRPSISGAIEAEIKNLVSRPQEGRLRFEGKSLEFHVDGKQAQTLIVPGSVREPKTGELYSWNRDYILEQPKQKPIQQHWSMDYFYVPKVNGPPDWSRVPVISMTNMYRPTVDLKKTSGGHDGDLSATFQLAWDDDNLYLRVEAEDDVFNLEDAKFWGSANAQETQLYFLDGCLEVYFDCAANGRTGNQGYDLDDYRYDFSAGNPGGESGPALVYRFREVYQEYAGGPQFPSKEKAAAGIQAEFSRISLTRYAYTITFAQKYIAPLRLEAGYEAGFGLFLHDRMDDGTRGRKGLSLATEAGEHCDNRPELWPIMILKDTDSI